MSFAKNYTSDHPTREELDQVSGPLVVEFGTGWCGYCRAAQPLIAEAFEQHQAVQHHKIEDGKGRRLGRTFGVKLWPTLIFMRDGEEVSRLVRPRSSADVAQALSRIQ